MSSLPHHIFSTQEIRVIEQNHAATHKGHCFDLMERAGRTVFEEMRKVNSRPSMVYVLAGKGNNGGDGYIVAAYLMRHHIPFRIFATDKPRENSEAFAACSYFIKLGGKVEYELPDLIEEANNGNSPDIVIDALLGTGLNTEPRETYVEWINFINSTRAYIIAVDVPSGVNANTGHVYHACVTANKTVCMLGLKSGLVTGDAVDYVGEIVCNSLGVDVNYFHGQCLSDEKSGASYLPVYLNSYEDIIADLPVRLLSDHKGRAGRLLVIGGSHGYGGSIAICGQGALRAGAGLVKVATAHTNVGSLNAARPELMTVDFEDLDAVAEAIEWTDVIALGPGLGTDEHAIKLLDMVISSEKAMVLDADALNIMSTRELQVLPNSIMTPHPGEAARLLGCSIADINADRYKAVYELQQRCGGTVLLKGAGTLVCDGNKIFIIREGSPTMASGGMGDLLTGIIAALRAEGLTASRATICGAAVHGRAGRLSGDYTGEVGCLACDLLPYVRYLVSKRPGLADHNQGHMSTYAERATSVLLENRIMF